MFHNQFKPDDMKKFLMDISNYDERNNDPCSNGWFHRYHETICTQDKSDTFDEYYSEYNLESIRDDKHLSYAYRVGVFYMWDANKCDYAEFHIAFQNDKDGEIQYLGKLDFKDGENMDILATVQRIAFSMIECTI